MNNSKPQKKNIAPLIAVLIISAVIFTGLIFYIISGADNATNSNSGNNDISANDRVVYVNETDNMDGNAEGNFTDESIKRDDILYDENNNADDILTDENTKDDDPSDLENADTPSDPENSALDPSLPRSQVVADIMADMTLREKILQMVIIHPSKLTGVSKVTAAGETTQKALEKYPVDELIPIIESHVETAHNTGDVLWGAGLIYLSKRIGYEISLAKEMNEAEPMVMSQGKF